MRPVGMRPVGRLIFAALLPTALALLSVLCPAATPSNRTRLFGGIPEIGWISRSPYQAPRWTVSEVSPSPRTLFSRRDAPDGIPE